MFLKMSVKSKHVDWVKVCVTNAEVEFIANLHIIHVVICNYKYFVLDLRINKYLPNIKLMLVQCAWVYKSE